MQHAAVWSIAALATLGVILRPFRWNEAIWATTGAGLLVLLGLLSWDDAWRGVLRGTDVYLFLVGMMLLAEAARSEGLFDWLAGHAVNRARGSARRLFLLIYAVGVLVTTFLSNDATAVVLTPAVYAAARAAKAEPLPFLFICAFIANAASFVLPISNPANLVVYASHMPPLGEWLARFGLPSFLSIAATYAALRWTQRRALVAAIAREAAVPPLTACGKVAGLGIVATALLLMAVSAAGRELGLPTLLAGLATAGLVLVLRRANPYALLTGVSWSVLPLVAGLFVLIEALEVTGVLVLLADVLRSAAVADPVTAAWMSGLVVAASTNLVNNLPAGLLAGAAVQAAAVPAPVAGAILIGVDLGPNFSVTGSLATILWLVAIRREGQNVGALAFLKVGVVVTPPALLLALGGLLWAAH